MRTVRLWLLLRRRASSDTDPQRLAGTLAVIAFAVTTATALLVLGGWRAFGQRAQEGLGGADSQSYVTLAGFATLLLLIPLATLGGAAARLAISRRDTRLAALRLAGATAGQVAGLTVLEASAQAALGALIGVAGYFALIPAVLPVVFQGVPFTYGELLVPVWWIATAIGAVVLIATGSAAISLSRIVVTPLGVANRTAPKGLHWTRVLPILVALGAFALVWNVPMFAEMAIFIGILVVLVGGGLAAMNAIGPLTLSVVGRIWAKHARSAASLIAARRLADNPKTAWRSVGGIGLATFVAGITSAMAMFNSGAPADSELAMFMGDIGRGGQLTLVIAAVVAAVSTGVLQAGRVIDQRAEYRALHLAGTDLRQLNAARLREVAVPLAAAVGLGAGTSGLFLLMALGSGSLQSAGILAQFALSVLAAAGLVMAGSAASSRVVRAVLA